MEAITVSASGNTPQALRDLLDRCFNAKPDKKALAELRKYVSNNPGFLADTVGLAKVIQSALVGKVSGAPALTLAVEDEISQTRRGLNYDQAPMLEKLIIQNIENCQLRLQWVEHQLSGLMGKEGIRFTELELWEKRLSISQLRLLRACETLARVRKLTSPVLQLNIAQEGGQQVNVAGDVVKNG